MTIKEVLKAVYLAGVENGANKRLDIIEILHRKDALEFNPAIEEAIVAIEEIHSKKVNNEYIKLNIEHAVNELIGIVKYTEYFDQPDARERQLKRNEEMRLKTIKRLNELFDKKEVK